MNPSAAKCSINAAIGSEQRVRLSRSTSEIVWKPSIFPGLSDPTRNPNLPAEPSTCFTAHFNFVPLWHFEGTTGRLRFVPPSEISGVSGIAGMPIVPGPGWPGASGTLVTQASEELAERQWLVTVGDALMIACSRAFLFKHQPLQAWLDYTKHFGFPGLRGITNAARGTPEFAQMEAALATFMKQLSVVMNSSESIDVLDLKGHGQPPFADLVERMDRVMAALWRGADLGTISRDRGYGASLQDQEGQLLEEDDARTLSEHLNATLDRWVLEMLFGPAVQRCARVKILVTPEERTPHDLAVDQFLVEHGARLSMTEALERYGRAEAKPGEPALSLSPGSAGVSPAGSGASRPNLPKQSDEHASRVRSPEGVPPEPFPTYNLPMLAQRTVGNSQRLDPAQLVRAGTPSNLQAGRPRYLKAARSFISKQQNKNNHQPIENL